MSVQSQASMYFQIISEQTESDSLLLPVLITVGQLSWRQAANKKTWRGRGVRVERSGKTNSTPTSMRSRSGRTKEELMSEVGLSGYETSGGVGTLMETRKIRSKDCTFRRVQKLYRETSTETLTGKLWGCSLSQWVLQRLHKRITWLWHFESGLVVSVLGLDSTGVQTRLSHTKDLKKKPCLRTIFVTHNTNINCTFRKLMHKFGEKTKLYTTYLH